MMNDLDNEIYECEFCGHKMKWDESDATHGEIWGCEMCGKAFCTKCFAERFGFDRYMEMMQDGDYILCPECEEKLRKENERTNWLKACEDECWCPEILSDGQIALQKRSYSGKVFSLVLDSKYFVGAITAAYEGFDAERLAEEWASVYGEHDWKSLVEEASSMEDELLSLVRRVNKEYEYAV